jgi:CHAT domain-containing protein
LDSSYRNLGMLRREQGDLAAASVLLDRTVDLSMGGHPVLAVHEGFHQRGLLRLAQGRLRDAVEDLRVAVRLAREWRWSVPTDDAARVGMEGWLEKVHSAFVAAANGLYLETHDSSLLRQTFEAAEENRANSLRTLLASRGDSPAAKLPASYWNVLDRLREAEVQALRTQSARDQEAVAAIRAELQRMEMPLGHAAAPLPADLLDRTRALLGTDTALLSFHLGESASWLWAVDHDGLVLYRLPPRTEVEPLAKTFAEASRKDSAQADTAAEQLYRILLGALDPRFQRKPRWLLALDRGLFEIPMAALRTSGQYLCELHAIEIIPGAGAWVEAAARPRSRGSRFVGIGDAIYNTADPRLPADRAVPAAKDPLLLPRLVASGREVESCARVWRGEHVLLEGRTASRANLVRELERDPAVVHLATHVLESGEQPAHGLIALGLNARRENDLIPPQEIAGWRTRAGMIVMSGCHSAEGPILPGTGLLGLTRAWLAAGARSVIASSWATPDEDGALFHALYRNLAGAEVFEPAAALRAAQLAMIREGGWRSRPSYWGAYFVVGTI